MRSGRSRPRSRRSRAALRITIFLCKRIASDRVAQRCGADEVTSLSDRLTFPFRATRMRFHPPSHVNMVLSALSTLISTIGVVAAIQQQSAGFTLPPVGAQLPAVAVELVPASGKPTTGGHDCRSAVLCNQGAWADFGLALAGLMPKQDICSKYQPSSSCASIALTRCRGKMDEAAEQLLVSFAHIVISWCYDDGQTLAALNEYSTCYSMAALDSLITHSCLSKMGAPHSMRSISSAVENRSPEQRAALAKTIGNFLGGYQSGAIVCLHKAVKDTCGLDAANLLLGPAIELLKPSALLSSDPSTNVTDSPTSTTAPANISLQAFNDTTPALHIASLVNNLGSSFIPNSLIYFLAALFVRFWLIVRR